MSSTGRFLDSTGAEVVLSAGSAGLFTADYSSAWGGRIYFFTVDDLGDRTNLDITTFDIARYEATVVYQIVPAPSGAAVLLTVTAILTRRRR